MCVCVCRFKLLTCVSYVGWMLGFWLTGKMQLLQDVYLYCSTLLLDKQTLERKATSSTYSPILDYCRCISKRTIVNKKLPKQLQKCLETAFLLQSLSPRSLNIKSTITNRYRGPNFLTKFRGSLTKRFVMCLCERKKIGRYTVIGILNCQILESTSNI